VSRKYKQSGYQDEGSSGARRKPSGPRERPEGPRGRGLGAPTVSVFLCRLCGEHQAGEPILADSVCTGCGADLRTCTHCAHFDTSAPFECREDIPQRISKKAARNDCDLFRIKLTQEFAREVETASDAKTAFDDLFDF